MRTILIIAILGVLYFLNCAKALTRQFIFQEQEKKLLIEGWEISPEFYAYKNIVGADTTTSLYSFKFDCVYKRPIKNDTLGEFTNFDIETVRILYNQTDTIILSKQFDYCYTNISNPYIRRKIRFGESFAYIPFSVKNVTIQFTTILRPGRHYFTTKYGVLHDTLTLNDSQNVIDSIFYSIPMIRKDSEITVPANVGE